MDDEALLARCRAVDPGAWSDAMDQLDLDGLVEGLALRSGQGGMCGFAVTARQVPGRLHDFDKADFAIGRIVDSVGAGQVLVIDVGGEPISSMGGLAAYSTRQRGAAGVLIDGACRDLHEIRDTGLWLASRHVSPRTGKGRLRTQQLGEPVRVGGITVAQGDLVSGDETGIVVVPRARLVDVLERAEAVLKLDRQVEERIKRGESFSGAAQATGYIPKRHS